MNARNRNRGLGIALAIIVVLAGIYYDSVLDKGPLNAHLWRQTDCLSMTKNYQDGAAFLEPEMHVLYGDQETSGKSAGEFPILYYCVGSIWKITGESFLVYRLFYLLILVGGLLAFFRSVQILLKSNFWAISLTVLLFTSPVLVFYGVSFLTDAPAFCFMLMALYFFTLYQTKGRIRWLYFFAFFSALAGLLKISMLISFVFIGFIYVLEFIPSVHTLGTRKLFEDRKHAFVALSSVVAIISTWYLYAVSYSEAHSFHYTFNAVYSLWDATGNEMNNYFGRMNQLTIPVFYSKPMLLLLAIVLVINLFFYKKMGTLAFLSAIIIPLGALAYFLLWAPLMGVHDYYYVAYLVLIPGVLVPFVWMIRNAYHHLFTHKWIQAIVVMFVLFNVIYCREVIGFKTSRQTGDSIFIANTDFKKSMKWFNWRTSEHWNSLYFIRPHLKGMGVMEDDKVICFPDFSFNTSLYLLKRKGWTAMRPYQNSESIEYLKSKGAKFLVIHEPALLEEPYLQPYLQQRVGGLKNVSVFRL